MRNAAQPFVRKLHAFPGMAVAVMAALGAVSFPAKAQMNPQMSAAAGILQANCAILDTIVRDVPTPEAGPATLSKSNAILGGAQSALDRIRQQQAGLVQRPPVETVASMRLPVSVNCSGLNLAVPVRPESPQSSGTDENFLASPRIAIGQTSLSAQWNRVASDTITGDEVRKLIGNRSAGATATLQTVNGWVNRAIAYAEDREIWNSRDYWALASQTLSRREGDCEDLAILKYQMLRAIGVAPEDMFLTLARDLARNADHAVLVVRHEGRFFLLDNATDAILPANLSYDYRPTLSFSGDSAWLHGITSTPPRRRTLLTFGQGDIEATRDGLQEIG